MQSMQIYGRLRDPNKKTKMNITEMNITKTKRKFSQTGQSLQKQKLKPKTINKFSKTKPRNKKQTKFFEKHKLKAKHKKNTKYNF